MSCRPREFPTLGVVIVDEVIAAARRRGGGYLRRAIAGDEVMPASDLATAADPGLFGPASVAWRVHGDSAMLIGGLRALLLQTLQPQAMAGVADHSDYRNDPWGRLHRTGRFVGGTTFGNSDTVDRLVAQVRAIHERIVGETPDGRPYAATDPHLLLWVHATEVDSFLRAYRRYGEGRLTDAECDRYVAEMAELGRRLGAEDLPETVAELDACLDGFRAECRFGPQARDAVRFLLLPPVPLPLRGAYGVIGAASVGLLPGWARSMMWLPPLPGLDPVAIRPAATVLTRAVGWFLASSRSYDLDDRLLSDPA